MDVRIWSIPKDPEEAARWPDREETCPACGEPYGDRKLRRDPETGEVTHRTCPDARGLRLAVIAPWEEIRSVDFPAPPSREDVTEALAGLLYGDLPEEAHLDARNLYTGEILAFVDGPLDGTEEDGPALGAFVDKLLREVADNRDPDLFPRSEADAPEPVPEDLREAAAEDR